MGGRSLLLSQPERRETTEVDIKPHMEKKCFIFQPTPFAALCRHIAEHCLKTSLQFQKQALIAMQISTEDYLYKCLCRAQSVVEHAGRKTVKESDLKFACRIDGGIEMIDKRMAECVASKHSPPVMAKTRQYAMIKKACISSTDPSLYFGITDLLNNYLLMVLESCNLVVQSRQAKKSKVESPKVTVADVDFALNNTKNVMYGLASRKH
jgi:histone H3/H4